jgi:hypothetical protein
MEHFIFNASKIKKVNLKNLVLLKTTPNSSGYDQVDVKRIVRVLLQDTYLIDSRGKVWMILDIPHADCKMSEDKYRTGLITINDLFIRMISCWISKTNGNLKELRDILDENGFRMSAGNCF